MMFDIVNLPVLLHFYKDRALISLGVNISKKLDV